MHLVTSPQVTVLCVFKLLCALVCFYLCMCVYGYYIVVGYFCALSFLQTTEKNAHRKAVHNITAAKLLYIRRRVLSLLIYVNFYSTAVERYSCEKCAHFPR